MDIQEKILEHLIDLKEDMAEVKSSVTDIRSARPVCYQRLEKLEAKTNVLSEKLSRVLGIAAGVSMLVAIVTPFVLHFIKGS